MGKSRRLEKAAKGGHAKVVNRAAEEGGEKFYERQGVGLDEQQEVVQVAQEAPRAKRLTARQKKKLEKVVEKKQKNAARAQLIADLQACLAASVKINKRSHVGASKSLRMWLQAVLSVLAAYCITLPNLLVIVLFFVFVHNKQAAQLPTDQLQYMRRTADMGRRKETQKQRLRRELMEEKAGLPVPQDSRLHQKRAKAEDGASDEEGHVGAALTKKPKTSQVRVVRVWGGHVDVAGIGKC
jgi:hypothetical protein